MFPKKIGASLLQYAIILAIIGAASVAVLIPMGQQINLMFNKYLTSYSKNSESIKNNAMQYSASTSSISKGDLSGTPNNPQKLCSGSICSIDYGSYVLNGIPSNFADYVQSSGTSGGTEKISDLMSQIAKQLESDGNNAQAEIVKKLASTGHNLAKYFRNQEDVINSCNGDIECAKNALIKNKFDINKLDLTYIPNADASLYTDSDLTTALAVGVARACKINDNSTYQYNLDKGNPAYLFVEYYDQLESDPNIADPQKAVIKELYWQIGKLSEDVESGLTGLTDVGYYKDYDDPLTGKNSGNSDAPANILDIYKNYKPSSLTHLDSALICASENYNDNGTSCH